MQDAGNCWVQPDLQQKWMDAAIELWAHWIFVPDPQKPKMFQNLFMTWALSLRGHLPTSLLCHLQNHRRPKAKLNWFSRRAEATCRGSNGSARQGRRVQSLNLRIRKPKSSWNPLHILQMFQSQAETSPTGAKLPGQAYGSLSRSRERNACHLHICWKLVHDF